MQDGVSVGLSACFLGRMQRSFPACHFRFLVLVVKSSLGCEGIAATSSGSGCGSNDIDETDITSASAPQDDGDNACTEAGMEVGEEAGEDGTSDGTASSEQRAVMPSSWLNISKKVKTCSAGTAKMGYGHVLVRLCACVPACCVRRLVPALCACVRVNP